MKDGREQHLSKSWRWVFAGLSFPILLLMAGLIMGRWTQVSVVHVPALFRCLSALLCSANVHVSASGWGVAQAKKCVRLAMMQSPDIIVFVGDLVIL